MIQTGSSGQMFHSSFSLRHLARCLHYHRQEEEMTVLFCFSAFIVSLAVVPALAICSAVFTAAAFVCPMLGVLRLIFSLLSLDVPFVKDCVLSCLSPCAALAASALLGTAMFIAGRVCWHLLLSYLDAVDFLYETVSRMAQYR